VVNTSPFLGTLETAFLRVSSHSFGEGGPASLREKKCLPAVLSRRNTAFKKTIENPVMCH